MSTTKHTTIEQLKKLALRTKNEIGLVDAKVAAGLEDLQHIDISVTLPAANWSGGAQTVAHASLLADSNYIYLVGADAGTRNVYDSYGVSADNVTTSGQMTFRCDTTPTVDLSVFIIRLEVGTDE